MACALDLQQDRKGDLVTGRACPGDGVFGAHHSETRRPAISLSQTVRSHGRRGVGMMPERVHSIIEGVDSCQASLRRDKR